MGLKNIKLWKNILLILDLKLKKIKKYLYLEVPSWRPDISQSIDIVEELARIKGYDKIKTIEPEKVRLKPTLNKEQKVISFSSKSSRIKRLL